MRKELTEDHKRVIERILSRPWIGPKGFVRNILNQGWCSDKQEKALYNIHNKYIEGYRNSFGSSWRKDFKKYGDTWNSADHDELHEYFASENDFM